MSKFVEFLDAYYRFAEQYDTLPLSSTFEVQTGLVSVQSGNSTIVGSNTSFSLDLTQDQRLRVGSDVFQIRSIANNTQLVVYDVPVRSYFANTYSIETNKTVRQASGTLRQIPTLHEISTTISDFIPYFRDTYMREIPQGVSDTATLVPKMLEFYQSRGSEEAFRFLFRALYGNEIELTYPREHVFKTSDGEFEIPRILKVDNLTYANSSPANTSSLELRQIKGLTSNAIATVVRAQDTYDGARSVASLFVDDIIVTRQTGSLLLESDIAADDGRKILIDAFGTPPEGNADTLYTFELALEDTYLGNFIAGETISTVPVDDPLAITGTLLGSVVAFTVESGGSGYAIGDLVYPTPGYNGGYGAIGRVESFANTDVTGISIADGGDGYYVGISLDVDSSGTGGSGLAGYVSEVSPGHFLHEDSDTIVVPSYNEVGELVDYQLRLENVDYYQVGQSMSELFWAYLIDSDDPEVDGCHYIIEDGLGGEFALVQESAVALNAPDWGFGDFNSSFYGANLQSTIVGIISNITLIPIYVNGVRTEVGAISAVVMTSPGSNYILAAPTVSASIPVTGPLLHANGYPISTSLAPFESANLVVDIAQGQIGSLSVYAGGSGYSASNTFTVNAVSTSSQFGNNAVIGFALGALVVGQGRFKDTKGFTSADRYLQDITYYQPYSYVLTVEDNITNYGDAVKKLLHPAGSLLITKQTITSVADLSMSASDASVAVS